MKITTPKVAPNIAPDTPMFKTEIKPKPKKPTSEKNINPLIVPVSASNLISVPDQIVELSIFPDSPSICHFIPVLYNATMRIYLIFNDTKETVKFPIISPFEQLIGAIHTPTSNELLIIQNNGEQVLLRYLLDIKENNKIKWNVDTIEKKQYIYITKYKGDKKPMTNELTPEQQKEMEDIIIRCVSARDSFYMTIDLLSILFATKNNFNRKDVIKYVKKELNKIDIKDYSDYELMN